MRCLTDTVKNKNFIHMYIVVVYACIFIIPSALPFGEFVELQYSKFLFYGFTIIMAFVYLRKMNIFDCFICIIAISLAIITESLAPFSWISTVILARFISEGAEDYIKDVVLTTKMNYISLIFVVIYSFVYGAETIFSGDYQIARTAVYEVNQSGLAILCLGLIFRFRNKIIGNSLLCFGMLTLSRNYIMALLLIMMLNSNLLNKTCVKLYKKGILKFSTIIIVTTLIVVGIGSIYVYLWISGDITYETGASRLGNFLDYSNFYRFSTNITFMNMMIDNPIHLLIGYPDIDDYRNNMSQAAMDIDISSSGNTPHNFLLSYFRLYGISSIIFVIYISKVLDKIISKNNIAIFLAICLYPVFMSAGFNNWWLYLTVFVLLIYKKRDRNSGVRRSY